MSSQLQANRLLGYSDDARLLIINADDFGMCRAVNEAVIRAFGSGLLCSTTLMMPCPWALHAVRFLKDHPEIPFGVHLTAISDSVDYLWRPLTVKEKVSSLVDQAGYFYTFEQMPEFLAQVSLNHLEREFRAQIEAVFAAGLKPTHLDWHALRIGGRADISEVMLELAKAYGLALRVAGRAHIGRVQSRGLPTNDHDFLDSYLLESVAKGARYEQLLRGLPVGLSEWAVHPGLDTPELRAIDPDGTPVRQADFDFLVSPKAKETVEEEGIVLLDYRALQTLWSAASPP